MSIAGGDVESVSSSVQSSGAAPAPATPRNRVKFLCSHGGKILPSPADGRLKYVGGDTRLIAVPRDITFNDLMNKLSTMFDLTGEMILKCQLIPEDLDVLVTVKSDEDIRQMIEECDQRERLSAKRLRAFLFSTNRIVTDNQIQSMDPLSPEERYINSVNGINIHPPPTHNNTFRPNPVYTNYTTVTISSTSTSPTPPPETTIAAAVVTANGSTTNPEATFVNGHHSTVHRNQSSTNLGVNNHQTPVNHHPHQQGPPQLHHVHPHQLPKPPLDRHPH